MSGGAGAIAPFFHDNNVSIVFAADDAYAPVLSVALASLVRHASPDRNYDVIIFEDGFSALTRRRLSSFGRPNVSIRFFDIKSRIRALDAEQFHVSGHINSTSYYRLFVPDILPEYDKIVYLDGDLVMLADAGDLYFRDISDNLVGASRDLYTPYNLYTVDHSGVPGGLERYLSETLEMANPYDYLQAGVLVMNLRKMREEGFTEKSLAWLRRVKAPLYHDQCTLNHICRDRIAWIPQEWNFLWEPGRDPGMTPERFRAGLPPSFREEYDAARANLKVLHLCSGFKAWMRTDLEYSGVFWSYARLTPYYEELLAWFIRHDAKRRLGEAVRDPASTIPAAVAANREVEELHEKVFTKYRDANRGRDVVLLATGPSLSRYTPLPGALHIGVNRAFQMDKVRLDYLFVQFFPGIGDLKADLIAYGDEATRKFYGLTAELNVPKWSRPEGAALSDKFEKYYCLNGASGEPARFAADIAAFPLSSNGSVVFPALQFALYTRPARIFLVGCDSTGKGNLGVVKGSDGVVKDKLLADWLQFKAFAELQYPEVEIASVNPVRLAGLFRDVTV